MIGAHVLLKYSEAQGAEFLHSCLEKLWTHEHCIFIMTAFLTGQETLVYYNLAPWHHAQRACAGTMLCLYANPRSRAGTELCVTLCCACWALT